MKRVNEFILQSRGRIVQIHHPFDKMTVKDQGHGVKPRNIQGQDSICCQFALQSYFFLWYPVEIINLLIN